MNSAHRDIQTPRLHAALADVQALIQQAYPLATFTIAPGDNPEGLYLWATVAVDDTDAVVDVYIDRLLTLQVEEGLPLYVIPVRPPQAHASAMAEAAGGDRPPTVAGEV